MQKSGRRLFGFKHKQDSNVSQALTYSRSEAGSVTREFSNTFFSCFIPRTKKVIQGANQKNHSIQTGSETSITSSNSGSILKRRGLKSSSTYETCAQEAQLSIAEIFRATCNFSQDNVVGQGGFGTVYKGKLMDGSLVAVKRATKNIQKKGVSSEFRSEIGTLSKIEHQNLVRFLGCVEDNEEQIVVTEYVGNGTLREHLDDTRGCKLELEQRLHIAIDVSHAITYLHTYTDHPIIHRDIKSSNILLTENLRAKVADFGFARLAAEDPDATHISTQIKGTAGYLDPEYILTYQLTEKSDVYSFGVLLIELITGRQPIERGLNLNKDRNTTRWAMQKFRQGEVVIAMDQRLRRSPASIGAVNEVMGLACSCLASPRNSRPSMKRCAELLWGIRRDFHAAQLAAAASRPAAG
ncbi:calmodulin-binding receptor-like cytoplasmic kinase 2 isoform X2 [Phalaenopsis equestris]|uniref:calmodulin-binding receptor-like cytoplasmic kinase 2 isoform X2 n=1 Tax=Phalaenopsis equestris TaxID=78828 RepID=UPI0009E48C2F|nr:calmodulin-binding receptor-like cytoplasmic kinase 2 isoform X2 [Phalaenopsis equestris]